MEEEDDDDIYAPEDVVQNGTTGQQPHIAGHTMKDEKMGEDLEDEEEEGEEVEEEESDSVYSSHPNHACFALTLALQDIDIITERKDEPKTEAPYESLRPTYGIMRLQRQLGSSSESPLSRILLSEPQHQTQLPKPRDPR